VRVVPIDLKPHTSRNNSSRVKVRVGAAASARSRANSFLDKGTRSPSTQTSRESGSSSSVATRIRPTAERMLERRSNAPMRPRSSPYENGFAR
jgi:hypothetical protein